MAKSKRTPNVREAVLASIRRGNFLQVAAAEAGIDDSTLYAWKKNDPDFARDVKQAELVAEAQHINNIKKHSIRNWMCSAWWLQRKVPERWVEKTKMELTPSEDAWKSLSREEKLARIDEVELRIARARRELILSESNSEPRHDTEVLPPPEPEEEEKKLS